MSKYLLVIFCLCAIESSSLAQSEVESFDDQAKRIRFTSIQQIGLVGNEVTTQPMFQLIAGASYARYFLGIGSAIDPYFTYSFPIFLDGRFTFYERGLSAYAYGAAGINKLFYSENRFPRNWENGERAYHLKHGLYYDYGIGMRTKISGGLWYNFSAGISFKETKFDYVTYSWPARIPSLEHYRNIASRFTVKMGLQF